LPRAGICPASRPPGCRNLPVEPPEHPPAGAAGPAPVRPWGGRIRTSASLRADSDTFPARVTTRYLVPASRGFAEANMTSTLDEPTEKNFLTLPLMFYLLSAGTTATGSSPEIEAPTLHHSTSKPGSDLFIIL